MTTQTAIQIPSELLADQTPEAFAIKYGTIAPPPAHQYAVRVFGEVTHYDTLTAASAAYDEAHNIASAEHRKLLNLTTGEYVGNEQFEAVMQRERWLDSKSREWMASGLARVLAKNGPMTISALFQAAFSVADDTTIYREFVHGLRELLANGYSLTLA